VSVLDKAQLPAGAAVLGGAWVRERRKAPRRRRAWVAGILGAAVAGLFFANVLLGS